MVKLVMERNITGICVVWNTRDLIQRAYESIRKYHNSMKLIIVDGSDNTNPCAEYLNGIRDDNLIIVHPGRNIGHGRGAHLATSLVNTKYFLLFDSDIEMKKSPLMEMSKLMNSDTYGIGYCVRTGYDGFDYGVKKLHWCNPGMLYLHPYFALVQLSEYLKYPPLIHHGSPFVRSMLSIHKAGMSDKIIKFFNTPDYIFHDNSNHGGTGRLRISMGLPHIDGSWDKV